MSNDIQTAQSFQERMFNVIRSKMGDLMTDEELKRITETALHKAFFEEVRISSGSPYRADEMRPSVFVQLIKAELAPQVQKAVAQWIATHPKEVETAIQDTLSKGIVGIVSEYLNAQFMSPLEEVREAIRKLTQPQ